jgi:hypothetical protein
MTPPSEDGDSLPPGFNFPQASVRPSRSTPSDSDQPPSARFQGEDFLFHLYRGSELLQDNCVEEAKEELERALRMQPLDIEGQGLLGVVYFRLGLYPRAIEIYREIIKACPDELTPKLNLSLCYLKTGQPGEARDLLSDVIQRAPDHRRAWGYLGLSFERLGEYARAQEAFEKAGQPTLARRMQQLLEELSHVPSERAPRDELRRAAADAVEELDASSDGSAFERAVSDPHSSPLPGSRWRAHEPGEDPLPPLKRSRRPSLTAHLASGPAALSLRAAEEPTISEAPASAARLPSLPITPDALVNSRKLEASGRTHKTAEGLVYVKVDESFAVRSDRLRAICTELKGLAGKPFKRRLRGRELEEDFGGTGGGWTLLEGKGSLLLEPGSERELTLLSLAGEFVYLREARLVGFDGSLRHENGRLPAADPGPVPMVQLAGEGLLVFEARRSLRAISVSAERGITVRAASVLGWTGRLLGQALPPDQALPLGAGFVVFSGDGAVLVDDP